MAKNKNIKLKKIGISYSFKDFYKDYFGKKPGKQYLNENIGGVEIRDLKGYWWEVDEEISNRDFYNTKPKTIKPILIIVHGRIYDESARGRINRLGNVAYVPEDNYMDLF